MLISSPVSLTKVQMLFICHLHKFIIIYIENGVMYKL